MSAGTITELSPQDGLGWITLDDGTKVRFGGSVCRGMKIELGLRVRVLGTAPGFRGVTKATGVVLLDPPPPPPPVAHAPRAFLAKLDALEIHRDSTLRAVVQRADADDAFFDALEALSFELAPMPAADLDCPYPEFTVVAMDGGGNAYGLYRTRGAPGFAWAMWDHEDDSLAHVADDTAGFFAALLASFYGTQRPAPAARVRTVLGELGVALPAVDPATALRGTALR